MNKVVVVDAANRPPYQWICRRYAAAFGQLGWDTFISDGDFYAVRAFAPDLVIVPGYWIWLHSYNINKSRELIRWTRQQGIPLVGFFMDEPWDSHRPSRRPSSRMSGFFSHQAFCEPTVDYFPNPIFLPHAYDPEDHRPQPPEPELASNLIIVGRALSPRAEWLVPIYSGLCWRYRFLIYGNEWPLPNQGLIGEQEGFRMVRSSQLALNIQRGRGWHVPYEQSPLQMWNERLYHYSHMGILQVCDWRESLARQLPELPLARTPTELRDTIERLLQDPAERRQRVEALYRRTYGHTYRARMALLLKELGLVDDQTLRARLAPGDRLDPHDYRPALEVPGLGAPGPGAPGVPGPGPAPGRGGPHRKSLGRKLLHLLRLGAQPGDPERRAD